MSEKNVYQIVDEKLITVMDDVTQKVKDTSGGLALSTNQYAKFYTVPNYNSEECIQFKDTYTYNSLSKSEVMTFTTDFDGYVKQEYKTNANSSSSISLNNSYAKVTVNDITILNLQLKDGITSWIFPVKSGDQVETIVRTGYDGQDGCDFFRAYKIPFSLTIPSIETLPSGSSTPGSQGATGADGKSAYEIAVENGFEGTEEQWLESLHGHDYTPANITEEGMPIGTLIAYSGDVAPAGWLECDGQAVSRSNYYELFNVIGTTYGSGDGVTTFNLPDYRNKFIEGSDTPGASKDAGLPNITGLTTIGGLSGTDGSYTRVAPVSTSGAFTTQGPADIRGKFTATVVSTPFGYNSQLKLDASRSSNVYGNSETVQPASITAKVLIKAKNGLNVEVTTAELDYENRIYLLTDEYFSSAKAVSETGWGNGYGFVTLKSMPSDGVVLLRINSSEAKKGIAVFIKGIVDEDYHVVGSVPTASVLANAYYSIPFHVVKGDNIKVLVIDSTGTSKVTLQIATFTPYKTVKVCGADGNSAYEIAVKNGFQGTETEWLESIRGIDGNSCSTIDWGSEENINVNLLDSITSTIDSSNIRWTMTYTAPFDCAVTGGMVAPTALNANNILPTFYFHATINDSTVFYDSLRYGANYATLYNIKKGDKLTFELLWNKSITSGKPTTANMIFRPYKTSQADSYSTTETQTSKTWIDGKPIYRKVIVKKSSTTIALQKNTWATLGMTNIPENIESVVNASIVGSTGVEVPKAKYNVTLSLNSNGNDILYYTEISYGYTNLWLILEYTKTTD